MNKTIIININGIVFHIEEDAYDTLRSYMIEIKKHFGNSEDSKEILGDIENRIAEMFTEKIQSGYKEVIVHQDVDQVISQMGRVSDFELDQESAHSNTEQAEQLYESNQISRKLMRDPDDKMLGGVCSGLAYYFDMEPRWMRLIFIILFLSGGIGFLFYIILWIVIPKANTRADRMAMRGEAANIQNFKKKFDEEMGGVRQSWNSGTDQLGQGLQTVGDWVVRACVLFIKLIGIILIFSIAAALIVLLIAIIASFGAFGSPSNFSIFPLTIVDPKYFSITVLSAVAAVVIPIIFIISWIIRILFSKNVLNKYINFSLATIWVLALISSIYYIAFTISDFNEKSTLVEERPLQKHDSYYLTENDLRTIHIQDSLGRKESVKSKLTRKNWVDYAKKDIKIRIEKIDSLSSAHIKYEYSAKGKNYETAATRASKINYTVKQQAHKLSFAHFRPF